MGSIALGGCGLPSTDSLSGFVSAGNGNIQGGPGSIRMVYDVGKKIEGKKLHFLVDMTGSLRHAIVHPADIQDRNGAGQVTATLFCLFWSLLKIYAVGGYQVPVFQNAAKPPSPTSLSRL
jgi:hypothetical protein